MHATAERADRCGRRRRGLRRRRRPGDGQASARDRGGRRHACLLVGPPGAGKTMLARRLPSILPALTEEEALEVTAIHSVAGLLSSTSACVAARPFRAPHHSISSAGLVGGGSAPRPGEVSLAHHGVLFLDELLEFPRGALEALRQPLEDGRVVIARAALSVAFPGAILPRRGDESVSVRQRRRADARVHVLGAGDRSLSRPALGPARRSHRHARHAWRRRGRRRCNGRATASRRPRSARASRRAARCSGAIRVARIAGESATRTRRADGCCRTAASTPTARDMLGAAMESLKLSARGYHRVLRVSRTIADLEQAESVSQPHVAEALRYRPR